MSPLPSNFSVATLLDSHIFKRAELYNLSEHSGALFEQHDLMSIIDQGSSDLRNETLGLAFAAFEWARALPRIRPDRQCFHPNVCQPTRAPAEYPTLRPTVTMLPTVTPVPTSQPTCTQSPSTVSLTYRAAPSKSTANEWVVAVITVTVIVCIGAACVHQWKRRSSRLNECPTAAPQPNDTYDGACGDDQENPALALAAARATAAAAHPQARSLELTAGKQETRAPLELDT